MVYTRRLKIVLAAYADSLSKEEFLSFENYLNSLIVKTMDELEAIPRSIDRAHRMHELVETEMGKSTEKTSCSKGCAACCYLKVEVTQDEADSLIDQMNSMELYIDDAELDRLAIKDTNDELWAKGIVLESRCIFLNVENECSIYEFRPLACRRHLVSSPSEECFKPEGNIKPIFFPMVEVILSAALSFKGSKVGALATMLKASREKLNPSTVFIAAEAPVYSEKLD